MKMTFTCIDALALLLAAGCASRPAPGGFAGGEPAGYTTGQNFVQQVPQPQTGAESQAENYLATLSDPGPF